KLKLQVIQVNSQIDRIGDKLAVISLENAQYQWFSCSGGDTVALTGQISFEFSPPENGNYLVKIYFGNCEFVSDCFNFVKTSSHQVFKDIFSVYPIPVSEHLTLHCKENIEYTLEIQNVMGKEVFQSGK